MSRSCFTIMLDWHMLENRKACVPGYEDSSGGHLQFKVGPCKLRVHGPESGHIDGAWTDHDDKPAPPFDMEKWVDYLADDIIEDLMAGDKRLLKYMVRNVLTQAKEHCDACHQDVSERFKKEHPDT